MPGCAFDICQYQEYCEVSTIISSLKGMDLATRLYICWIYLSISVARVMNHPAVFYISFYALSVQCLCGALELDIMCNMR